MVDFEPFLEKCRQKTFDRQITISDAMNHFQMGGDPALRMIVLWRETAYKVETFLSGTKVVESSEEILSYIDENLFGVWNADLDPLNMGNFVPFYFELENDALIFKMRWG